MSKKVKNIIIEQLTNFEVENIYGYAGDTILPFFSAIDKSNINLYTTTHEGTAGLMASAEGKLRDHLAVCTSHSGPGTANMINGIGDAFKDRVPLLLISGQVPSNKIGTDYKQFLTQQELLRPLTVYSAQLTTTDTVIELLYKAVVNAISKGGVSQLIVPIDLWEKKTSTSLREYPFHLNQKIHPDNHFIEKAAKKLNESQKPVILYGRGVRDYRNELLQLAEKTTSALIATLPARGMIEFDHPLNIGGLGKAGNNQAKNALKDADLVIILGATWWPANYVPQSTTIIQYDATAENIGKNHPVEVSILGDLQFSIQATLDKINYIEKYEWKSYLDELRKEWFMELETETHQEGYPLPPQAVVRLLSEQAEPEEIFTLDSGDNVIWFAKYFGNRCQDIIISGSWRTMGFGLPAALSAMINKNNKVTCIVGDGGLNMFPGELLTAARYNLPLRIVVFNNGELGMERHKMESAGMSPVEVTLNNPDYIKLAEACGIDGVRVENLPHLESILYESKNINKALLIDVPVASPTPPGTKLY